MTIRPRLGYTGRGRDCRHNMCEWSRIDIEFML